METNKIQLAADQLWEASASKQVCDPIRTIIAADDLDSAYAIQAINTNKRLDAGATKIGCKIGLTSPAVQAQLGVDQPDYGILFNDMQITDELSSSLLMQPKAEAEMAFVLGKDLDGEITEASVLDAVDYACASIEIVGSRIRDWDIKIADTIADNASASHFVLSKNRVKLDDLDLVNCTMKLFKNGEQASVGSGKACMGSPLNAAVWLAKTMKDLGNDLKKGDIILTGALGPMVNIAAGDHIEAEIEGLGKVSFKTI